MTQPTARHVPVLFQEAIDFLRVRPDGTYVDCTLGLAADEQLVGTIAIGTPTVAVPERDRPDPSALLADWTPA